LKEGDVRQDVGDAQGGGKQEEAGGISSDEGGTQKHVSFNHQGNIPSYTSLIEDCNWVPAGMVATSVSGDSTLAIQQRVEDAGFSSIVVTPMGSDCVFLDCTSNDDGN